jgi:hypothetical protein
MSLSGAGNYILVSSSVGVFDSTTEGDAWTTHFWLIDRETGNVSSVVEGTSDQPAYVSLSPDGNHLLVARILPGGNMRLEVRTAQDMLEMEVLRDTKGLVWMGWVGNEAALCELDAQRRVRLRFLREDYARSGDVILPGRPVCVSPNGRVFLVVEGEYLKRGEDCSNVIFTARAIVAYDWILKAQDAIPVAEYGLYHGVVSPDGRSVGCYVLDEDPYAKGASLVVFERTSGLEWTLQSRLSPLGFVGKSVVCIDALRESVGGSLYAVDPATGEKQLLEEDVRAAGVVGEEVMALREIAGRWYLQKVIYK